MKASGTFAKIGLFAGVALLVAGFMLIRPVLAQEDAVTSEESGAVSLDQVPEPPPQAPNQPAGDVLDASNSTDPTDSSATATDANVSKAAQTDETPAAPESNSGDSNEAAAVPQPRRRPIDLVTSAPRHSTFCCLP
jgi:hypothetical protein